MQSGPVVPSMRIMAFWGLYWVSFVLGNYHFDLQAEYEKEFLAAPKTLG